MSGKDGIRGYFVQTIIALLEALQSSDWNTIILEPSGDEEKVDIILKSPDYTKAIQVRSSANQISMAKANQWAAAFEQCVESGELVLIIVGPCSGQVAKVDTIGRVKIPQPKNLETTQLIHEAAHLLDKFLRRERLVVESPEHREQLVGALITTLTAYSTNSRPLPRSSFVQLLKDWLAESANPPVPSLVLRALSKIPKSCRTGLQPRITGRDTELSWLNQTAGDKLIYAQPGMGKTFLLQHYAVQSDAFFLTIDEPREIIEAIHNQQPTAIIIEDGQLHLKTIQVLKSFRAQSTFSFDIIVDAWPGDKDQLAVAMDLSASAMLELCPLDDDSIVNIINKSGIEGPNALLHTIVHQSTGCPGRAVMLIDACLQKKIEDWRDVFTGEKLARWVKTRVAQPIGNYAIEVLACCSLRGSDGICDSTVGSVLKRSESEVRDILHRLGVGGLIVDLGGRRVMVVPELLRGILVRDIFFRPIAPVPFENAVREVGISCGLVKTIIAAHALGASFPDTRLLELVELINSGDVWREYACSCTEHAERVIRDHPRLILSLADVLLRRVPEKVIPHLLNLAARDLRPEHQAPDHPIRRIRDWVQAGLPGTDALKRREITLEAFRRFMKTGRDCDLAVPLVPVILSPLIEVTEQSPADRECFRSYRVGLSDGDLYALQPHWDTIFDILQDCQVISWKPILAAIQSWLFPYFGPSGVSPEQLRVLRGAENAILDRAAQLAVGRPGVLTSLRQIATRRNIRRDVLIDETFAILFPGCADVGSEHGGHHLVFAVNRLAEVLVLAEPLEVVRKIQWCIEESDQMLDARPNFCIELSAAIAERVDETIPWIDAMICSRCKSHLLGPFLERAVDHEQSALAHRLRILMDHDDFRREAIRVALVCVVPAEIRKLAIAQCSHVPDLIEGLAMTSSLSNDTIESLLTHPDHAVVSNTLRGLWHAQAKRPLADSLRMIWLKAAARHLTDEWCLQQALTADLEFRGCWLAEQCCQSEHTRQFVSDKSFEVAVSALTEGERCETLEMVSPTAMQAGELVKALVGGSGTVYARLFAIQRLSRFNLRPLERTPDCEWVSLAICASTHCVSLEEIVSSSRKHFTMEFPEVPEKFHREIGIWTSLTNHDQSTISDAAKLAISSASADLNAWQREHQLERFR